MSVPVVVRERSPSRESVQLPPGHADLAVFALEATGEPPEGVVAFLADRARGAGLAGDLDVCDLACGTGRRLACMQQRGWRVRAAEPDRRLRMAARGRFSGDLLIDGTRPDHLDVRAAFDLVLAWDGALAYLPGVGSRMTAVRRALRALRPGGLFVLELPHLLWNLSQGLPPVVDTVTTPSGHEVHRVRRDAVDLDGSVVTRRDHYTVRDPTGAAEEVELVHRLSIVTTQELAHALQQAGFSAVETWSAPDADAPGPVEGPRIIVVARR
ncbi:MAG: class I SAM-dependent methyltransferase [Deltaproteobacteria bacterium]|nr:MAG: class I SAM-dependent methyltransferase [Deltaproteobacteria bacterium]